MCQAGDSFELRETLTLYGQLIFAKPITASIASANSNLKMYQFRQLKSVPPYCLLSF
jgi:hypothetical protein